MTLAINKNKKLNHINLLLLIAIFMTSFLANLTAETTRERLSLNSDWRFFLGDIPMPVIKGHGNSYNNAKAGKAWGAAASDNFDDSDWRKLDLPHDWAVEGPFDKGANISQGYRPRGLGWYRKYIKLDEADKGKHLELQFDGISTHATVWVNGLLVHRNWCGYTSFSVDITPLATFGDQINSIAIRVDANEQEGWWYEGAGIYRHTWLIKRNPVHIETDGIYANPVRDDVGKWSIPVEVTLANFNLKDATTEVTAELFDAEGKSIITGKSVTSIASFGASITSIPLNLNSAPKLWSIETPTLYSVKVTATSEGKVIDSESVNCGFRTIRFDAANGFFLNDKPVKLQGTCNHQDHAGVGVAIPDSIHEFRVRKLKEMGSNAYRSAHNPPSKSFLDACDKLGMLVMDENRNFNYTPEYMNQLRWLLKRDRNHPSIILWSVFNEEPMQGTTQGRDMVRRMVAEVRRFDKTRPTTAAMNGGMMNQNGVFEAVDVMGFNYCHKDYVRFHKKYPNIPITSSEDTSTFMTRGEFESSNERNVINSYDTECASWGKSHRMAWKVIADQPFLAGGFVWTGFDYRGEPQKLSWPSVSSVFGIVDLCGFPKTAFYIHQAHWIHDRPVLAIAPHWNWSGSEGKPIKVIAMTNAEKVSLSLNGQPLGEKETTRFDYAQWVVPYAPGKLEAVAFKGGKEVARAVVETTGEAVALQLSPDRTALNGDGFDAMPITVSAVDAQGRVVPRASPLATFSVAGPGKNIGHGNGDHNCHDPEKGPDRRLFHGLAQLIVQSNAGASGALTVKATSPGLKSAEIKIPVKATPEIPVVAGIDPLFSNSQWRHSPPSVNKPDPLQTMSAADMNTWIGFTPGSLQTFPAHEWSLYRATFKPRKKIQTEGGIIQMKSIHGIAEVWLDGRKIIEKNTPEPGPISVTIPPGANKDHMRTLTLLIQSSGQIQTGLDGVVTVSTKPIDSR